MSELFQHPAFLPALISCVVTAIIFAMISAMRIDSLRTRARDREKKHFEVIEEFQKEESKLRAELTNQRISETDLIKRLGELESRVMSEETRQEEIAQFLGFAKSTLQTELRKHENSIVKTLQTDIRQNSPKPATPVLDDRDFVPPAETPREDDFEGFAMEPPSQKAESAANVLRAALEDPGSES